MPWRSPVTDNTSDQSRPQPKPRSPFSARKLALMATVVAGLGAGAYGFAPSPGHYNIFGGPANAQVSADIGKAAQPTGFADIVQRVKPSVISVKVTMSEKV